MIFYKVFLNLLKGSQASDVVSIVSSVKYTKLVQILQATR